MTDIDMKPSPWRLRGGYIQPDRYAPFDPPQPIDVAALDDIAAAGIIRAILDTLAAIAPADSAPHAKAS